MVLDPVHVTRGDLEHVPLAQQVPLRRLRIELPILPRWVSERKLERVGLAVSDIEDLNNNRARH